MPDITDRDHPMYCPPVTQQEHFALQSLKRGDATPHQQQLALQVIINKFARSHDLLISLGSPDGTGVLNGRAFVGQKILKYLNLPIGRIDESGENQ